MNDIYLREVHCFSENSEHISHGPSHNVAALDVSGQNDVRTPLDGSHTDQCSFRKPNKINQLIKLPETTKNYAKSRSCVFIPVFILFMNGSPAVV